MKIFIVISVATPMISFSHPVPPLIAGTNVSVICNVTLDHSVNSNILINVTWQRDDTELPKDMERELISSSIFANPTSFISVLTLSPLIDKDNATFSCEAIAYSYNGLITNSSVNKMNIFIPVSIKS